MRVAALGVRMLRAEWNLRLPTGAVRIAASAAFASTPRSVAVFDLCIAVTGTRLDTVRVVFDQVVDIIVEIRVSLPVDSGCSTADTDSYMHRVAMLRVRPEE
jgi:hypothetical protein